MIVDFDDHTLAQLTFDDKMLIRCRGAGMKLLDYPGIAVRAV